MIYKWSGNPPTMKGSYLCRMDDTFIKMCYYNGNKWSDMWSKGTLEGDVKLWMNIPPDNVCLVSTDLQLKKEVGNE